MLLHPPTLGIAEKENDALLKPIAEAYREVGVAIDAIPHLLEVPGGIHPANYDTRRTGTPCARIGDFSN